MTDEAREEWLIRAMGEYGTGLMRLAFLYLGDRALAEDAVQEAFLRAYRHLDAFRGESSEKTWLTRISINICLSLRKCAWMSHFRQAIPWERADMVGKHDCYRDDTLIRAVMDLPIRLRQVILLYYYQEMSGPEIARSLGISEQTVRTRLHRGREKLSKALKGWYFDEE